MAPEFEGDDLEDALRAAAAALGTSADSLDFEVLEEGRRGVFGLGARRVRITVTPPTEEPPEPVVESPEPQADAGLAAPSAPMVALQRIFGLMRFELSARAIRRDDGCRIELSGRDRDALVKNGGELLAALQFVLNRMGRRAWPEVGHVQLDCTGYRDDREESVTELAREVAAVVARTGLARRLHPMNPFERRLVHVTVGEYPGLTTRSEGDGFLKRIIVERSGNGQGQKLEG